uniref:Extended synaptotagmin-like protein 2a n=1 Tax=Gasterosteus aculeatus aculeatus TaxID=481459 RepID=A0AAQ4RQ70_GASAC
MKNAMEGSVGPDAKANGPIAAPSSPVRSTVGPPLAPQFGKTFALILPIYILGYFEFSFSWVLVGLAALCYWKRNHGGKDYRINRAMAFLEHEDKTATQSLATSELPPWVHYPDVERVEWLNKTVKQMWPFICQFVDKLFRETIEPAVKGANPHLASFCFTKIDMGDKPLRVDGVKVYTENVDKRQIIMDLQISFVGNTEIDVHIKKYYCRAGIQSIQLHGMVRVVMEPLLGDMPLIGALSVFFLKKPLLDINWTGLTHHAVHPAGVNGLFDNVIQDIIASQMVLPNRISIPLVQESQLAQLRFPIPKGILRIHFMEAQDLLGKDKFLGGLIKGKSDPYGFVRIGTQVFQSKVIHENLNPKWNEVYEAFIYDYTTHNLEIELFDEDTDKDDFLGSLTIDLAEVQKERKVDEWFVIENVDTGKLHLKLEWLSLLPTPEKLDQVQSLCRSCYPFSFFLLQSGKKVTSSPSPFVQFTVGHKPLESKIRYKTNEPVWEEAFTFLIHNPKTQELQVEVKDKKHDCSLGTLTFPLSRLLEAEDMTLNQRFPLRNSGPNCTLQMKMALRVGGETLLLPSSGSNPAPSSAQVGKNSSASRNPRPSVSPESFVPPASSSSSPPTPRGGGRGLADTGRSTSNLAISGSQQHLAGGKEPTPSIASDISYPYAAQELQQRLQQLQKYGPSHYPLGEIQLTVRLASQRNKLVVVVHSCRNLIAFTDHGSDPYVRLYLLPDKRRSGRRKTHTIKKTLNPVYDQTFEFNVSLVELHRRTLDVAVKNGGGLLSKHKGLLGKVLVDLTHEESNKSLTQWYELSEDGLTKSHQL